MTITLRLVKGGELTHDELDDNFIDLNNSKAPLASPTFTGTVGLPAASLSGTLSLNAQTVNPGTPTPVSGAREYLASDSGKTFDVTSAGTQTIPAGLGAGWTVDVWNSTDSDVTIDGPGGTNVTLAAGQVATVKYLTATVIRVAKGDSVLIS